MTGTGWTPSEVDEVGPSDVDDLFAAWEDAPPAHVGIRRLQAALGYRVAGAAAPRAPAKPSTPDEVRAFFAQVNGGRA